MKSVNTNHSATEYIHILARCIWSKGIQCDHILILNVFGRGLNTKHIQIRILDVFSRGVCTQCDHILILDVFGRGVKCMINVNICIIYMYHTTNQNILRLFLLKIQK